MARPNKSRLLVTQEQFDWMRREIGRRAQVAATGNFRQADKKPFLEFDERLSAMPELEPTTGLYIVNTNRNDLRILEKLNSEAIKTLTNIIVPGYGDRIQNAKTQEEAKILGDYRRAASNRAEMLIDLNEKVARSLRE